MEVDGNESQKSTSPVTSFKTSITNAYSTPAAASRSLPAPGSRGGVRGPLLPGSGGEAYSTSASMAVFGTLVTRRCSAVRSEKSLPRAGRAVVAAKTEVGFVGIGTLEEG